VPGLLGGAVAVDGAVVLGAVVVGACAAPGLPLGGAAVAAIGTNAIDPAAMRRLRLRFMRKILSSCVPGRTLNARRPVPGND
jgi:hypothetical protein